MKSGDDHNRSFPLENEHMKSAESMKEASTSVANISIHVVDSSEIFCADNDKISSERLIQDPFADTIETDSDEVLSEVLDMNSDDNSNIHNRNSRSSQHFRKAHFTPKNTNQSIGKNLPALEEMNKAEQDVTKITAKNTNQPIGKNLPALEEMNKAEQDVTKITAKNTNQPIGKNLPALEEMNKAEQDVTKITAKNTNQPIDKNLPALEEMNKDEQDVTKIHIQKLDGDSSSNVAPLAERALKKFQPIIESLDNEKIYYILDRYSDILVEMVKEKLKNV